MLINIKVDKASEAFLEQLKENLIELEDLKMYRNPMGIELVLSLRVYPEAKELKP